MELQALALHFMLKYGLNVHNVDQTKIVAFAHLLTGEKIPVEDGKEVISKSPMTTVFAEMWQKPDEHHIEDLRLVLALFKPLEATASGNMGKVVQAIEEEIAKTEARLKGEAH